MIKIEKLITAFDILEKVYSDQGLDSDSKHRMIMLDGVQSALLEADPYLASSYEPINSSNMVEIAHLKGHFESKVTYLREIYKGEVSEY